MQLESFSYARREQAENSDRREATSRYSAPSMTVDSPDRTLWLAKRALHVFLCIAIPFAFWAIVIRWSTENIKEQINQQVPQHDMKMEVKKFEIKEFDMEGFRKSMGMPAE